MKGGFYEQLGVEPGASTGQIRAAYGRAVAQLVKRSKSMVEQGLDPTSLDAVRAELDEAWQVLSDPVRRRGYDAMRDWLDEPGNSTDADAFWKRVQPSLVHPAAAAAARLLRRTTHLRELGELPVGPSAAEGKPTLVPDEEDQTAGRIHRLRTDSGDGSVVQLPTAAAHQPDRSLRVVDGSPEASDVIVLPASATRPRPVSSEDLARMVDRHGFSGALLRAVREARGIGLEELADTTRISARYLEAIENDDHTALPSATFVRGYVQEMARQLKLDDRAVADGYMQRLSEA